MFSRHDLCDAQWDRIRHLLPGQAGGHGGVGSDTRLFVNVIRYLAKTGIAWADLPTAVGKSNSLWQRYNRWCANGVREKVAAALRDDDTEWPLVDSSCVRAHPAAAGANKKGRHGRAGGAGVGRWRVRHQGPRGREPARPSGNDAPEWGERGRLPAPAGADCRHRDDGGAGRQGVRRGRQPGALRAAGAEPCIPPRRNRSQAVNYDRHLYREWNGVERFFGRVKQWRRAATRYDKKGRNVLGFVWLTAIDLLLA